MNLLISNSSEKPIYQQLYEQISAQILSGELKGDSILPPIREAAKDLRISIITVKKTWEELERNGLIYTITGKGCYISKLSTIDQANKKESLLLEQLEKDLAFYKSYGLDLEELFELIKKKW
jgi:GntR family transcriptional regulator